MAVWRRYYHVLALVLVWLCSCEAGSLGDQKCPRVGVFMTGTWSDVDVENVNRILSEMTVFFLTTADALQRDPPLHVYISVGAGARSKLGALPSVERIKWVHVDSVSAILLDNVYFCFFSSHLSNNVMPSAMSVEDIDLQPSAEFFGKFPLVSVFVATFRSGEKIWRVINSLRSQTYQNWELVLVDDSNDSGETYRKLSQIGDPRVRVYLPHTPSGFIGAVKRYAAGLCLGKILVEMDHDDALEPSCLSDVVKAYVQNPKAGFVYGDYTEWYLERRASNEYEEGYARGFGSYYREYSHVLKAWVSVAREPDINSVTLRDSVGYPNHVRTWRADFYALIGGHNVHLPIADDIEILMRTFLRTQWVRIPRLGYVQYREPKGNNFTFLRLKEIRKIQRRLAWYYRVAIDRKLKALGMRTDLRRPKKFYKDLDKAQANSVAQRNHGSNGTLLVVTVGATVLDLGRVVQEAFDDAVRHPDPAVDTGLKTGLVDELVAVGYGRCTIQCMQRLVQRSQSLKSLSRTVRYWALNGTDILDVVWYATMIAATVVSDKSLVINVVGESGRLTNIRQYQVFRAKEPQRNFALGGTALPEPDVMWQETHSQTVSLKLLFALLCMVLVCYVLVKCSCFKNLLARAVSLRTKSMKDV
jgi:glycosyltransferase involved in cell wall biosynthesis